MIVAEQMQNTVQQQKYKLMLERHTRFGGIGSSALGGDHHIPQQQRLQATPLSLLHGKRDDIGRPVALQVIAVDLLNAVVINQQNRQFCVRKSRDV